MDERAILEEVHFVLEQHGEAGDAYVCHAPNRINSRGILYGDDPLTFAAPLLMLQLSLISIITRTIYLLLKPFGQPLIVSQILGGVILGPSILGHNTAFAERVFPTIGRTVLDTFSVFGFMLFIFIIGVKLDPSLVLRSGKRVFAVGILGFVFPYALSGFTAFLLNKFIAMDHDVSRVLDFVVSIQSMTAFPVIAYFLTELKILNSEIGHLATSSSIVCDICSWSLASLKLAEKVAWTKSIPSSIGAMSSNALLILFIVFGIRPAALWAIRNTPEGKPVKESYVFAFLVTLFGCGFIGEVIGQHAIFTSFLLGLVIPDGPPLGAALVEKLDCFVSALLMPIFFTRCGLKTNVFVIRKLQNVWIIQLIVISAFVGKFIGAILPPLFFRMPFRDAISLALIMNSKGIIELATLNSWKERDILNDECFAIMIISEVVITGVLSPVVRSLYDPSRRYLAYKRRTILHNNHDEELRILVCVHSQDNVRGILNLLEASKATEESPIRVCVLHLVELVGCATSLLVAHRPHEKPSPILTRSERIFNIFKKFEQQNEGLVTFNFFTGTSPYVTMHDDVCSIALEKRSSVIIIPFHKQWVIGGTVQSSYAFRNLNRNVLEKAPCSVGILIDRGHLRKCRSPLSGPSLYGVALLFLGGADDREALAYARRMAEHSNIRLTVFRFSASTEIVCGTERSMALDFETLNDFRLKTACNERVVYQEEVVIDAKGMLSVIQSLEYAFDLVMVGRRHSESLILRRLKGRQRDCPELGTIGDILASADFKSLISVLVVQQQARVWGLHDPEESLHLRKKNLLVNNSSRYRSQESRNV